MCGIGGMDETGDCCSEGATTLATLTSSGPVRTSNGADADATGASGIVVVLKPPHRLCCDFSGTNVSRDRGLAERNHVAPQCTKAMHDILRSSIDPMAFRTNCKEVS